MENKYWFTVMGYFLIVGGIIALRGIIYLFEIGLWNMGVRSRNVISGNVGQSLLKERYFERKNWIKFILGSILLIPGIFGGVTVNGGSLFYLFGGVSFLGFMTITRAISNFFDPE